MVTIGEEQGEGKDDWISLIAVHFFSYCSSRIISVNENEYYSRNLELKCKQKCIHILQIINLFVSDKVVFVIKILFKIT